MTHNLHIFNIINYSTFFPIRHFDIRRFVPFDIFAFDILSHSMLFLFDILSHSTLCPIRPLLLSTLCLFGVLSHSTFCPFDILSHSTFCHSAFCLIRRFVVWRFVHSAFVTSTFCRWTVILPTVRGDVGRKVGWPRLSHRSTFMSSRSICSSHAAGKPICRGWFFSVINNWNTYCRLCVKEIT
jgi:hypothetical protein